MYDYKLTVGSERVKAMAQRLKQLVLAIDSIRGLSEDVRYNLCIYTIQLHYTVAVHTYHFSDGDARQYISHKKTSAI